MTSSSFTYIDNSTVSYNGRNYRLYMGPRLSGKRTILSQHSKNYPSQFRSIPRPPHQLYCIGNTECFHRPCLSIIGARKATPYGLSCTRHFAKMAGARGLVIVSGGAYGCDSTAHRGALEAGAATIVFLGGGCDQVYPQVNYRLYQDIIDAGGLVVSEHQWSYPAIPYTFLERNRLIAACSRAVLIAEAGLPSGTFSTADEALSSGREVLIIPGAITSSTSAGSNRLLYQGATPIVDDYSFEDVLYSVYGILKTQDQTPRKHTRERRDKLLLALQAEPMRLDQIYEKVPVPASQAVRKETYLRNHLIELECSGLIKRFPDGRYGPAKL